MECIPTILHDKQSSLAPFPPGVGLSRSDGSSFELRLQSLSSTIPIEICPLTGFDARAATPCPTEFFDLERDASGSDAIRDALSLGRDRVAEIQRRRELWWRNSCTVPYATTMSAVIEALYIYEEQKSENEYFK